MADLPEAAPPRLETRRDPLRLVATDDTKIKNLNAVPENSDVEPQELDALHQVFPESSPPSESLLPVAEGSSRSETDGGRV